MTLGFVFVDLNEDQKLRRRELLDLYALIAQISFLVVLVLIRGYFLLSWLGRKWSASDEETRPSSPYIKHKRLESTSSLMVRARKSWERWQWWFGEPLVRGWGTKGEWLTGALWMSWLLSLCFVQTAPGRIEAMDIERAVLTRSRLPASHEAVWHHWRIATTIPLLPRHEIAVLSDPTSHSNVSRRAKHWPSDPRSNHPDTPYSACHFLFELLCPQWPSRQTHSRERRPYRTDRHHSLYHCWDYRSRIPAEDQLSHILHDPYHRCDNLPPSNILPRLAHPSIHLGDCSSLYHPHPAPPLQHTHLFREDITHPRNQPHPSCRPASDLNIEMETRPARLPLPPNMARLRKLRVPPPPHKSIYRRLAPTVRRTTPARRASPQR